MNSVLDGRIGGVWVCGCPKAVEMLCVFKSPKREAVIIVLRYFRRCKINFNGF